MSARNSLLNIVAERTFDVETIDNFLQCTGHSLNMQSKHPSMLAKGAKGSMLLQTLPNVFVLW